VFSVLLIPAVDGNNCELHVSGALPPEKEHRPSSIGYRVALVWVLAISGSEKPIAFAAIER
jgi:hypothetical protein